MEVRWRIRNDVRDKLPHGLLLAMRAALCAMGAIVMVWQDPQWPPIWPMVLFWISAMAALTVAHRLTFNICTRTMGLSRTREWWYMGSPKRRLGDSWYDTLAMRCTARRISYGIDEDGYYERIDPIHPVAPFMAATIFELAVAIGASLALHWRL